MIPGHVIPRADQEGKREKLETRIRITARNYEVSFESRPRSPIVRERIGIALSLSRDHVSRAILDDSFRVHYQRKMRFLVSFAFILAVFCAISMVQAEDYIHLPGKTCKDAPACPDGRPCVMAPPRCNAGTCGTDPVPTCGPKP